MFIGAIRSQTRPVLAEYSKSISSPVAIIGAGNFTVPAVFRHAGFKGEIIACDVSLYSSALGAYLTDQPLTAHEKEDCPDHLKGFLKPDDPHDLVASILLLFDLREVWKCTNRYHQRVIEQYRLHWDDLLTRTKEKLAAYKQQIGPITYHAKDGFQLLRELDPGHTILAFPPTYKRGYEKLEKLYGAIIDWQQPEFEEMTDTTLELYHLIKEFDDYIVLLEKDLPEVYEIIGEPTSVIHIGRNTKNYLIRKRKTSKILIRNNADSSPVGPVWPADRPIIGEEQLSLVILNTKQSVRMNERYMSAAVDYTTQGASLSLGYRLDGLIIGKSDFCKTTHRWNLPDDREMIYLMADLAVPYDGKLAKMILMALLSEDVQDILRQRHIEDYGWVGTTAFSRKPASMKYRGIFKLHKRTETSGGYSLNYYAPFGDYRLEDVVRLWKKKHG